MERKHMRGRGREGGTEEELPRAAASVNDGWVEARWKRPASRIARAHVVVRNLIDALHVEHTPFPRGSSSRVLMLEHATSSSAGNMHTHTRARKQSAGLTSRVDTERPEHRLWHGTLRDLEHHLVPSEHLELVKGHAARLAVEALLLALEPLLTYDVVPA